MTTPSETTPDNTPVQENAPNQNSVPNAAAPNERTNVSNIGFTWRDYLVFGSLIIFYILYFILMFKQKGAL